MYPDRKTHSRTALIIRSSIRHYEIDNRRDLLQVISIVVETWNGCIIISAVYSLPKHVIKNEQYIIFLKTLDNRFIMQKIIMSSIHKEN